MKMKLLMMLSALLLAFGSANAQERVITGRVTDGDSSDGLPGVNVSIKGTTKGTITDFNGKYSLNVANTDVLVFSFVGYISQEVTVGNQSEVNVGLPVDAEQLEEVVVTAFGMERETKALGYSVTKVDGKGLALAKEPNVINGLSGKVAGVQITKTAGGAGGSARVIIRGNNSLSGDNQPLYIVDGVPIDNSSFYAAPGYWDGGIDYGDGIGDINPDDIESMSILKGPSAAALYGSRAAGGVIIITTKTGNRKGKNGIGVEYNGNITFESPLVLPNYQNKYGVGTQGQIPSTLAEVRTYGGDWTPASWGAEMQGQTFIDWMGEERAYSPQENNISDFFQTGKTITNTIALTGGDDKANFRVSYTNLQNKGIVPTSEFDRNSLGVRGMIKPTEKLTIDAKVNYFQVSGYNRTMMAETMENPMFAFVNMPRSVRVEDLENYAIVNGEHLNFTNNLWRQNPYFSLDKGYNDDLKKRTLGFVSAKYEFTNWLSLQVRSGLDTWTHDRYTRRPQGSEGFVYDPAGRITKNAYAVSEMNTDFLFVAKKQLSAELDVTATLGGNMLHQQTKHTFAQTPLALKGGWSSFNNAASLTGQENYFEKKVNSMYGMVNLAYMNTFFLDITARNDWSSSIPDQSFFYPSVTGAVAFSELLNIDESVLTFGKVRGSWAKVGIDTNPYAQTKPYTINTSQVYGGQTAVVPGTFSDGWWSISNVVPSQDLLPQETISYEIGLDLKFFNNRVGLDAAYYDASTKNQILPLTLTPSSGASQLMINSGEIRNRGFEVALTLTPVRSADLEWNVGLNYTKNKNEVVALADGLESYELANVRGGTAYIYANVGQAYGDIVGFDYIRDENGLPMVDAKGDLARERKTLGNITPDWMGGISNSINYKNFAFNAVVDMKIGGDLFSYTNFYSHFNGNHENTVAERESGIQVNNNETIETWSAQEFYYEHVYNEGYEKIISPFVEDASYVKLRELSLGYRLPKSITDKAGLQEVTFSLVGRNLMFLYSGIKGIDPESLVSRGSIGTEFAAVPSTKSFGFNINVKL
ncbi:SusC/RagA family TonB-linked outer membrane protein [Limibacter armeniacum]|uniref:SusC/RagA family TonB-linked outer membrane protein n=1 Tax=Limibacter armeniacum TaxID=466084 RepID=UPI002FE52E3E